mmetsp:Transcript_26752/g.82137  ORF Transcript_26752/g.82137 Transcript_26752/m.82137 type:complete len:389 (-) Transcript_26752:179-1345(-)
MGARTALELAHHRVALPQRLRQLRHGGRRSLFRRRPQMRRRLPRPRRRSLRRRRLQLLRSRGRRRLRLGRRRRRVLGLLGRGSAVVCRRGAPLQRRRRRLERGLHATQVLARLLPRRRGPGHRDRCVFLLRSGRRLARVDAEDGEVLEVGGAGALDVEVAVLVFAEAADVQGGGVVRGEGERHLLLVALDGLVLAGDLQEEVPRVRPAQHDGHLLQRLARQRRRAALLAPVLEAGPASKKRCQRPLRAWEKKEDALAPSRRNRTRSFIARKAHRQRHGNTDVCAGSRWASCVMPQRPHSTPVSDTEPRNVQRGSVGCTRAGSASTTGPGPAGRCDDSCSNQDAPKSKPSSSSSGGTTMAASFGFSSTRTRGFVELEGSSDTMKDVTFL